VKQPLAVTILAWIYIAAGAAGFISGLTAWHAGLDDVLIEAVRLLAVVAGVFILRGQNWARWLALAWIGFHVVLSAFHSAREFGIHCLFFAIVAWILFRKARSYA